MATTHPPVKITRLERLPNGPYGPQANLGASQDDPLQANVTMLLRKRAERATNIFLLEWNGGKIPRGAVINGHTIAWTQHGRVINESQEDIGTYERTVEFGGTSGDDQKMIVYAN